MPNKCVPWLQSRLNPILPCAEQTPGLLRHAHIVTYHSGCRHSVSIQIFAQNIMDIIKLSHLCCRPPPLCWPVWLPHLWPGPDPRGAGGALHSGDIITIIIIIICHYHYHYQELDFLAKVSLSVLRSPDTRLRARMGGLGDQAPRNRWEVSTDKIVITCLQPDSLNKRLTV